MYAEKSVPTRIKRVSLPALRRLKARLMLEEGRNVSDADVISKALEFTLRNEAAKKRGEGSLLSCAGIIKGGKPTNASVDVDEVLYGDLNAND